MRDQVFISYSHKDKRWLEKLQTHLKPFERIHKIQVWDDTLISKGGKWEQEIDRALGAAKVAVLLVSPNYLASDFIVEKELSPLLTAAEREGLKILWVAVRASSYRVTALKDYQAVNDPARPLASLPSERVNEELVEICKAISEALGAANCDDSEAEEVVSNDGSGDSSSGPTTRDDSRNHAPTLASPPLADETQNFWTSFGQEYKLFHRAEPSGAAYRPDVLLVFVNGGGRTGATWDDLPAEVLSAAKLDVNVLSVEYPEQNNSAKRVRAAAAKLRTLLLTTFASYRHLLFVVHNGDAIVKRLLLDDDADVLESPTGSPWYEVALTYRSRIFVNVSADTRRQGAGLEEVVGEFATYLAKRDALGQPRPEVLQAPQPFLPESQAERRGNGYEAERPEHPRPPRPLAAFIAERLSPFRTYQVAAIARHTIARTGAMDWQVHTLFGSEDEGAAGGAATAGLGQAALLRKLTGASGDTPTRRLLVVTGDGGVGKSVLLRTTARRLAMAVLRGVWRARLPLFFTLSQFKVDVSDPRPERIWRLLCDEWAKWVNDLLSSSASDEERLRPELITVDYEWVRERLRRFPTTLMFDAVDEFLLNHPQLSLMDFASLLRMLLGEYAENPQFSMIMSIRSRGAKGATYITDSESQILTLRPIALPEAVKIFPSAAGFLNHNIDPDVRQLMLTPLILSPLNGVELKLEPEAYLNRATIIEAALSATITSLKRVWRGREYPTSAWLDALSLVAWLRFKDLLGDIEDGELGAAAARVLDEWADEPNSAAETEVVDAFRLLLDPAARRTLLRRSVFFSVRENSYRLKHRVWGDYLVSRYAVLCIRHANLDDLAARALNHDIYIMAGQQLQEGDTERRTVRAVVQRASTGGRFLILGNFAQMLGASFAPLTGDVLGEEILDKLHIFPNVVRFAMLSALGSRVLLADKRDEWCTHIRPTLLETFDRYVRDGQENAIVRSMSWCFLRALTNTDMPWPGLWQCEGQTRDTLSVIATPAGDGYVVDERQHSIQAAFMRIQSYALEIRSRVISTIHYLYPLVLAYNREVDLERTVVAELPALLSDLELDAVYGGYPVAEVSTIWGRCKELYAQAIARGPAGGRLS